MKSNLLQFAKKKESNLTFQILLYLMIPAYRGRRSGTRSGILDFQVFRFRGIEHVWIFLYFGYF